MKSQTAAVRRGTTQLDGATIARINQILSVSARETFGVAKSTLGRALAGFEIARGTAALIEKSLEKLGSDVPRVTEEST